MITEILSNKYIHLRISGTALTKPISTRKQQQQQATSTAIIIIKTTKRVNKYQQVAKTTCSNIKELMIQMDTKSLVFAYAKHIQRHMFGFNKSRVKPKGE